MTSTRRQPNIPIDAGKLLFPLGLATALSLMGDATLYAVLPTHTAEAGITLAGVGILLGVNRAVRLFLNGPAGLAYDRWPRRWLFILAVFIGALSTALYAATDGFWPLLVGRMLWGLAWSGIWVGGATMILDVATPQGRGRWTGLYQTWFFIGGALGALGGGVLTDRLGYTATMWIGAAITAVGGGVALVLLPETRNARVAAGSHQESGASAADVDLRPGRVDHLKLRANRPLWLAMSLQGVNRFVVSGMMAATLGLLVEDWARSTGIALGVATMTGSLMAARTLLSMVAAPVAGTASDRLGNRWTVAAWGLGAGALGVGLLAFELPILILLGVAIVAVSRGSVQSLATTLTGDLVGHRQRGRAIGLLHTVGDFGSAIGPSVAYVLLPYVNLSGVYLLGATLFLINLAMVLGFSGRRRSHEAKMP